MLKVLLVLWGSALVGRICRRWPQRWVPDLLTFSIWLMLFCIGIEVGGNDMLMQSLGRLGWEAFVATAVASFSCCVGSLLFWKYICGGKKKNHEEIHVVLTIEGKKNKVMSMLAKLKDSGIILSCFVLGCIAGLLGLAPYVPANATFYCLCILLACVGFSIGQSRDLADNIRSMKKKMLFLPLVTIVFTWLGMAFVAYVLPRYSMSEWMAVGSGFGYYSLSSILITEVKGAELGTIALLYNVIREIFPIIFAPLFVRYFGPMAPISVGGATTADTTLPAITRTSGEYFVPISIFHGITVDFTVPFLVPFFLSF